MLGKPQGTHSFCICLCASPWAGDWHLGCFCEVAVAQHCWTDERTGQLFVLSIPSLFSPVVYSGTAGDAQGVCMPSYLCLWFSNLDMLVVKDLSSWPDFPYEWKLTLIYAAAAAHGVQITCSPTEMQKLPFSVCSEVSLSTWHSAPDRWWALFASGLALAVLTKSSLPNASGSLGVEARFGDECVALLFKPRPSSLIGWSVDELNICKIFTLYFSNQILNDWWYYYKIPWQW